MTVSSWIQKTMPRLVTGSANHSTDDPGGDPSDGRFLSQAECRLLTERVAAFRAGGGEVGLRIESTWVGHTRYTRNRIRTSGDVLGNDVTVVRDIEGANAEVNGNQIDDVSLLAIVRRAERLLRLTKTQTGGTMFQEHFPGADSVSSRVVALREGGTSTIQDQLFGGASRFGAARDSLARVPGTDRASAEYVKRGLALTAQTPEPYEKPQMFFAPTYAMDPHRRASAMARLIDQTVKDGMLAAGYLETTAHGRAVMDTWGRLLYYPSTEARYSVTVRSTDGSGSGWAGVMWNDWTRVEPEKLQATALQKCLDSRNPARVEPGRYTAILEPQATHQLFFLIMVAMLGPAPIEQVDRRLTASQDPMDANCAFVPFDRGGNSLHAATWYKEGRLQRRATGPNTSVIYYSRGFALDVFNENRGRLFSGAYTLKGETAVPMTEMLASTQRGIYVTRFLITSVEAPMTPTGKTVHIVQGYTRDGTWLVENGKISKAIKNLRFRITLEGTFNNVEQVGDTPQRVYTPEYPDPYLPDYAAVVPALKLRDFAFTAVSDAV